MCKMSKIGEKINKKINKIGKICDKLQRTI